MQQSRHLVHGVVWLLPGFDFAPVVKQQRSRKTGGERVSSPPDQREWTTTKVSATSQLIAALNNLVHAEVVRDGYRTDAYTVSGSRKAP